MQRAEVILTYSTRQSRVENVKITSALCIFTLVHGVFKNQQLFLCYTFFPTAIFYCRNLSPLRLSCLLSMSRNMSSNMSRMSRNMSRNISKNMSRTCLVSSRLCPRHLSSERREIDFKMQQATTTTHHHPKLFGHFQESYHQVLYLFGNLS